MVYGWYKLITGIREQKYAIPLPFSIHDRPSHTPITPSCTNPPPSPSELAREKMWGRIHLIPLLQAEEDRDLVRRHLADQAREKELMGSNAKVYNSDR
jgi:hypothetical protein